MDLRGIKYLIVGSGFFGATIAERIANDMNERVVVVEKREHVGGNSFSCIDEPTGIECHKYGTHIFHTSNEVVWNYVNRFSEFNNYQHKVLTIFKNKVYQMPINLGTINSYYGVNLTPEDASAFIREEVEKEKIGNPKNLEEKAISLIGRKLYEAFIKGYTAKQWETDLTELPADIITRLPVRFNYNANYFNDPFQGMPEEGYYGIFEKMLESENITILTDTDYFEMADQIPDSCRIIYTGPIDRFFNYKYGRLSWRTLLFEKETHDISDYQGTSVMNYAEETVPVMRVHEFRHLHPERNYTENHTVIYKEFSKRVRGDEDPYYPVNTSFDKEMLKKYQEESRTCRNVIFGGRLGTYMYLDMDKTIEKALYLYENHIKSNR